MDNDHIVNVSIDDSATPVQEEKKPRGFARLDKETLKAIAQKGGKTVQSSGRGRRWTTEEAKLAGSKGGKATRAKLLSKGQKNQSNAA